MRDQALQALILDPELGRLEDMLAEFNLFDVLQIARRERQHSALLAWLLNPSGSHGLRDFFLRAFLLEAAAAGRDRGIDIKSPLEVDGWTFRDIEVLREHRDTDILLIARTDGFICLIENKIGSGEHSDQLDRYLNMVEEEYGELDPIPIYLTPDGMEPERDRDAARYVPVDYGRIAGLIDRVLTMRGSTVSPSVASFLEQYSRVLRRHIVATKDNKDTIEERAYQIYKNHREAIDLIIKAQSTSAYSVCKVIEDAMKRYVADLPEDHHGGNTIRRYHTPCLEKIPELMECGEWTASRRMVLWEFIYRTNDRVDLFLKFGPGSEETRSRLSQLGRPSRKLSRHHQIFRKTILDKSDFEPFDSESAALKVKKSLEDFFRDDYWGLVNAIREKFGLPAVPAIPD